MVRVILDILPVYGCREKFLVFQSKGATLSIDMAEDVAGSWVEYFEYCFDNHIHLDRTLSIRNSHDCLDPRIRSFKWIGRYWENPLFKNLFDFIKTSELTKRPAQEVLAQERSLVEDRV